MNNLIELVNMDEAKRTPIQTEALRAHERLIYDRQMVEVGLASMCRDLKEIRDNKYYEALGFDDFGAYTEQAHGIGVRQAYKYIRIYEQLGVEVLNSSSKIGVTKLLEIASLDKDERSELLAEHSPDELAAMSTDEVKRLTEQVRKLEEQLSFFESMPQATAEEVQQPSEELEAEIRSEVEDKLRKEYDEEMRKYRENADKEAKAAAGEETKKLKAELKAAKDTAKQNAATVEKVNKEKIEAEKRAKEAEEKAARTTELEAKIQAAEAEKAAIEKQIKLSANPELTRFKFLFEAWQSATDAMYEQLILLGNDTQEKMRGAIKAVMEAHV